MNIKNLYKTTRTSEWWEYKIPPLLAIAYATMLTGNISFLQVSPWLVFLLIALAFGGAYAHTVNDWTDIKEDAKSGKKNRMALIGRKYRWMLPFAFFLGGFSFFCAFVYLGDPLSAFIYGLPCVAFSLYSFPPFRLKHRGFLGVLADAFGAHVFISLLMVSSISYFSNQEIDMLWFSLVGLWSLSFGVRGILWHQYFDLENDLKARCNTFASRVPAEILKKYESALISFETLAFAFMLIIISLDILYMFVLLYALLSYLRYKIMGHKPAIVVSYNNVPIQIVMLDFYQVMFPLGILIYAAFNYEYAWVLLCIHLLLFPRKLINIARDSLTIIKSVAKSILVSLQGYS